MSVLKNFKKLLKDNCKRKNINLKFVDKDDQDYVDEQTTLKIIETNVLPIQYYFKNCKKIKKENYCSVLDIMNYIEKSVEDKNLGDIFKSNFGVLFRNPHFVIDYHAKMGWSTYYSDQIKILVEIIKECCDIDFQVRGIPEYNLNRCTTTDFRVDYYIDLLVPLIIEINEAHHSNSLITSFNDRQKDVLNKINFKVIQISVSSWKNAEYKKDILSVINKHIEKYNCLNVIENIIRKNNDVTEIIETLGKDIVIANLNGDKFCYSLSNLIKKFEIRKNTDNYKNNDDFIFRDGEYFMTEFMLLQILQNINSAYTFEYSKSVYELSYFIRNHLAKAYESIKSELMMTESKRKETWNSVEHYYKLKQEGKADETNRKVDLYYEAKRIAEQNLFTKK